MKVKKRLLPEYSTKNVKVYAIPQTEIIKHVGIVFTGGGHNLIYPSIPKNEIWIAEELMKTAEGKYYILHEWYEFRKMSLGMSYDEAHLLANRIEGKARKSKENVVDDMIKREMDKYKKMIIERSYFNGAIKSNDNKLHHHKEHRHSNYLMVLK